MLSIIGKLNDGTKLILIYNTIDLSIHFTIKDVHKDGTISVPKVNEFMLNYADDISRLLFIDYFKDIDNLGNGIIEFDNIDDLEYFYELISLYAMKR